MNELESKIGAAWLAASKDLGIEVVAPFILNLKDGREIEFVGLVKNFGATNGMLLLADPDNGEAITAAQQHGYGYSCLYESYAMYNRDLFIDALDDWGWTGPRGKAPQWYTGKPWTE